MNFPLMILTKDWKPVGIVLNIEELIVIHKNKNIEQQRKQLSNDVDKKKQKLEGGKERGRRTVTCSVCNCSLCYVKPQNI